MPLLHPTIKEVYPVGSIIKSYAPPGNNWRECNGDILLQTAYPVLNDIVKDINPYAWENWAAIDAYASTMTVWWSVNNGSIICAVGDGYWLTTSNGTSFNQGAMPQPTKDYYSIAWNGSVFFAAAYGTSVGATSSDGEAWTERTLPVLKSWRHVVWDGTYFILVPSSSTTVYRSVDGITWNSAGTISSVTWDSMASDGAGTTILIDQSRFSISEDGGASWYETRFHNVSAWGARYANNLFVLCTTWGKVGYSSNGKDWEFTEVAINEDSYLQYSNEPQFYDCVYHDGQWFFSPNHASFGYRSSDLKKFYPWYVMSGSHWESYTCNAIGNYVLSFSGYGTRILQASESFINPATQFQLPKMGYDLTPGNYGEKYYIRAE